MVGTLALVQWLCCAGACAGAEWHVHVLFMDLVAWHFACNVARQRRIAWLLNVFDWCFGVQLRFVLASLALATHNMKNAFLPGEFMAFLCKINRAQSTMGICQR